MMSAGLGLRPLTGISASLTYIFPPRMAETQTGLRPLTGISASLTKLRLEVIPLCGRVSVPLRGLVLL